MKRISLIAFFSLLLFSGCLDVSSDNETEWYSYGDYIKDESTIGYYINMDSGGKLVPVNSFSTSGLADSSRVMVTYTVESETGSGDDVVYNVEISTMSEILTKDIIKLTDEMADTIGNDGVTCYDNGIWLSDRHLNVIFYFYGYSQVHYLNLVKPVGDQLDDDGNQILILKHNANDDWEYYQYAGIMAFNMESLYEQGLDSINFVFQAMGYDSLTYEYFGTYYFKQGQESTKSATLKSKCLEFDANIK